MSFKDIIDILEGFGYLYLGFIVARFIYHAYILDEDIYERPAHKSEFYDYM